MNHRSKTQHRSQTKSVEWQITYYSDMEDDSNDNQNINRFGDQPRTFYNGEEEECLNSDSKEPCENFASFQTLSDQKTQGVKHSRRFRPPYGRFSRYTHGGQRFARHHNRAYQNKYYYTSKNTRPNVTQHYECNVTSDPVNSNCMPTESTRKYNLEFFPNCINTETSEELTKIPDRSNHKEITDQSDDCESMLSMLNKSKEEYFSMLKSVKPSEVIMDSRKYIEKKSNKYTEQHFEKICRVKSIIQKNKTYASIFELHFKNLIMQQEVFDECITSLKQKLSYIYDNDAEEVIKKSDTIKLSAENECILFNKTLPAYAYKADILKGLNENQVVIISSDNSYFFNTVTANIAHSEFPNYFVFSCESNNVSINWLRTFIVNNINGSELTLMTEEELLNFFCGKPNTKQHNKRIIVFNLPLKRSVISDLLLAVLRNYLHTNKDSRLILLVSMFDNSENYRKYFSTLKVGVLRVPKLVLPVKTIWKKESLTSLRNYVDEVVCTALSIHILNDSGDILAFLPNIADAKTAIAMFIKKTKELNYENVQCILIDENSSENSFTPAKSDSKFQTRTVFFTTAVAETISIKSVRYIIDCGLKRENIFDKGKNLDVMTTVFNSRATSKFRKCIAGIYSTGICYRIYSKENFCNDMKSFETPALLTLNPFNTFITLFHYQPETALSIDFVESLDADLKDSTIKHLKKFNAIKNGNLTPLGEKMGNLLLPARYSKFILQGIQWDCAYEAVILVAYFTINSKIFKFYQEVESQQAVDIAKLELIQHDSDALSFLHIFKLWMENNCANSWCQKYHIDMNALSEVKKKVDELCQYVYECLNETILQIFSEQEDSYKSMLEMLFECFSDHLCVFTGHFRSGYKILSSRNSAFLHPSSLLCSKGNLPQFIIFNKMNCTSRNFLLDITAIPDDMVRSALASKILDCDYSDAFERTLVSKVIEPVSEKIIKQILLGRKAKKLLEIENHIKKELNSELIVIEPSVEKCCVYVYALKPILDAAVDAVEKILKSNLDNLINAEQVYILDLKKNETILPLEVKCIMGAKIISAKVNNTSSEIKSFQKSLSTVEKSTKEDNFLQCSINLTWIRRPCTGICYANFNPTDFIKARKLAMKSFQILDSEVYIEVNKRIDNQLLIIDVPSEARSFDIDGALRQLLPEIEDIKIDMKFSPPFETTEKDIEKYKIEIQESCEEFTYLTDYVIIVPKPKSAATLMTAYINVLGIEDLSTAAECLSNTVINNFKITAMPVYRSIIRCNSSIYHAMESRIKEGIDKLNSYLCDDYPNKDLFRFQADIISEDMISLKLLSNDIHIMKRLQRIINELMEGDILDKSAIPDIHKLFCHGGHLWLRSLEKSQKVYILEEYNSKIIRVYGSSQNCDEARHRIFNFLQNAENETVETISLSSNSNNRMLLKCVVKEYGINLDSFVEQCELRSAVLNIKSCCLTLHGSRESINKAREILDHLSINLDLTEQYSLLSSGEMCPVCACPAYNLSFRLQHCGHLYCNECILSLVEQAQFPLQCCAENCSSDIILDDITRVLNDDPEKINKLLHSSLNDFLERNRTEIFYCPAPDCSMFFYKDEVEQKLKCPLCHNDVCFSCNVVYHHGFTCEMYQGSKTDPDYSFKAWKKGSVDCKECPRCKTAIERSAGCDHMFCTLCKTHFCWICSREFATEREIYNHIPFCDKYPKW